MTEIPRPLSQQAEEIAFLTDQLTKQESKLAEAERRFRQTTTVVVSRNPYEAAILGIHARLAQLQSEINPPPQHYTPGRRKRIG